MSANYSGAHPVASIINQSLMMLAMFSNLVLAVAFVFFLLDPSGALMTYRTLSGNTPSAFVIELAGNRLVSAWLTVFFVVNGVTLVLVALAYAFQAFGRGVRPDLAAQGLVNIDDANSCGGGKHAHAENASQILSLSFFGITGAAILAAGALAAAAAVVAYVLSTSDDFRDLARTRGWSMSSLSISGALDMYRNGVREMIGTAPAAAPKSSSGAK